MGKRCLVRVLEPIGSEGGGGKGTIFWLGQWKVGVVEGSSFSEKNGKEGKE